MPANAFDLANSWANEILSSVSGHLLRLDELVEYAKKRVVSTALRSDAHEEFLTVLVEKAYERHMVFDAPPIASAHAIMHEMYEFIPRCPACGELVVDDCFVSYREKTPVILCSRTCYYDWTS